MYLCNGYVCGECNETQMIKVKSVKVLKDKIMLVTFSTGETRLFDATILNGPAFIHLEDEKIFSNPKIEYGVVTWDDEKIDCAPEFMYSHSYEYNTVDFVVA